MNFKEEIMANHHLRIAIIMRSYNDIDVIRETLDMLSRQTLRTFELWNFASQSTDGTLEVIRTFNHGSRILVNDPANYNPGRILNEAVARVNADILVFLNSDATPVDEHWLERLVAPLSDPTVGAVFGRQVARPDCRSLFVKDTERAFGDGHESSRWLHFFSMANSAARSTILRRFPFEQAIQYSEDIDWSYRLRRRGFRIRYVPDAVAMHSHNYTLRQSWKRQFGEGVADTFIFRGDDLSSSWPRNFLLPFGMEVLRDIKWAMLHRSADALFHSLPLRFVQKWARWRGIRSGARQDVVSSIPTAVLPQSYTHDGCLEAEQRIARDQSLVRSGVLAAIAPEHFEALVLMGGYGRGEGGYRMLDGRPVPYNDYDYFVVVKGLGRAGARRLQQDLQPLAEELSEQVGLEVDLAVVRAESLSSAPFTLMNAEMKWGHRVIAGGSDVLATMPAMPIDRLSAGEFTRLMNNRGALLLMNARKLSAGRVLNAGEREEFFKYLNKAVLACGDARLAMQGAYHPSYRRKLERLQALARPADRQLMRLYRQALDQKFNPDPERYQKENPAEWQAFVTGIWLKTFRALEAQRAQREFPDWRHYARAVVSKGQLEGSEWLRNLAITVRDFGVLHALRNLQWAMRYPRERLISVLPLLLGNPNEVPGQVAAPLALAAPVEWTTTVDHYLQTWQRYA
jgi:rhamnosyltransferase